MGERRGRGKGGGGAGEAGPYGTDSGDGERVAKRNRDKLEQNVGALVPAGEKMPPCCSRDSRRAVTLEGVGVTPRDYDSPTCGFVLGCLHAGAPCGGPPRFACMLQDHEFF